MDWLSAGCIIVAVTMTLLGRPVGRVGNSTGWNRLGTPAAVQMASHRPVMVLSLWELGIQIKPMHAAITTMARTPPTLAVNHMFLKEKTRSLLICVLPQEWLEQTFAQATSVARWENHSW